MAKTERKVSRATRPSGRGGGDETDIIVATIRRLAVAHSVDEVIAIVTPAARALLDADGVSFVLRENDLCYYADEDAVSPLWKGKRFPMTACISGWCMVERQPVSIRDIYADARIPHDAYRPTFVRSLAMVPVRKEDPVAAMGAYWSVEREITPGRLGLLQTVADAAALALATVELQRTVRNMEQARHESGHRIKNLFSVVVALANQTRAETVDAYREAFLGRLLALERCHTALFDAPSHTVEVADLIRATLSPYVLAGGPQLDLDGQSVSLSAEDTTDLALIIHELATNAAKYGALSSREGQVAVSWDHTETGLKLTWCETGGPPVRSPATPGFGTRLIHGTVSYKLGGQVELVYAPQGLSCELLLPLRK
jgi:two-component sensor histidine kinase